MVFFGPKSFPSLGNLTKHFYFHSLRLILSRRYGGFFYEPNLGTEFMDRIIEPASEGESCNNGCLQ